MMDWVGFGRVVGYVRLSGGPFEKELGLCNSVLNPMVAHVNGFAAFAFGCPVGHISSGSVVVGDNGGLLRMAEVSQGLAIFAINGGV